MIIGIIFVAAGIIFGGNVLEVWDVDLFFDGWWTLFIIVPAVISMISSGIHSSNLLTFVVGVLLLLAAQGLFEFRLLWKLLIPAIFIWIGLTIIGKGFSKPRATPVPVKTVTNGSCKSFTAIFSGQEHRFDNTEFTGATITCVFGGLDLDLRNAIIRNDVSISSTNIFGGTDILLPPYVKCVVDDVPVFGGTDMKFSSSPDENAPTVYIRSVSVFGGMDVK